MWTQTYVYSKPQMVLVRVNAYMVLERTVSENVNNICVVWLLVFTGSELGLLTYTILFSFIYNF